MSIADKIRSILAIKDQIKAAILAKGVAINNQTPYADYPAKIQAIIALDTTAGTAGYTVTANDVKLTKVVLPSTALVIQSYAFSNQFNNREIVVQEGTKKLSSYCLYSTPSVEKVTLPSTLTTIETYALALNSQLLEITIPANVNLANASFLFSNNMKLNKIDIKACVSTTLIPSSFADNNSALTQLLMPPNVEILGTSCFSGCIKLKAFNFSNITSVGDSSFNNTGLESIDLPKASIIYNTAFNNTPILYAKMPKVTHIGISALASISQCKYIEIGDAIKTISQTAIYNAPKLEAIVIKATVPPAIENDSFPSSGNYKIYVPDASVAAYKAVYNWMFFLNRITPMSEFVMPIL